MIRCGHVDNNSVSKHILSGTNLYAHTVINKLKVSRNVLEIC